MSTWNPSDKAAAVTLSSGNLVASGTGATGGACVRSTLSHSTGKWYFEVWVDQTFCAVGIMRGASSLSSQVGDNANDYSILFNSAGNLYKYNGGTPTFVSTPSFTVPYTFGVAIDLDAGKIWFAFEGTWLAGGDPAAGTSPAYTGITGTYFPAWNTSTGLVASTGGAHFAAGTTSFSAPSGFNEWDYAVVPTEGTGLAEGTSTANAYTGHFGIAEGTSTASADGQIVVEGTGSAAGTSTAKGFPPYYTNYNGAVGGAVITYHESYDDSLISTSVTSNDGLTFASGNTYLIESVYASTSYNGHVKITWPAPRWILGATIYTSNVALAATSEPSDSATFGTFAQGTSRIWSAQYLDEDLLWATAAVYEGDHTLVKQRVSFDPIYTSSLKLDNLFGSSSSPSSGNTTLVYFVEIQGHTVGFSYTSTAVSTANIVVNTELHHVVYATSTANATSSLSGFETQTEVSTANITSSVLTQSDVTMTAVSTANATSSVSGRLSFKLVSTANATSTVLNTPTVATYVSTANATSSVQTLTRRGVTLVSRANATSHVDESVLSFTLVSTANATSNVSGTRIVVETLVSTANVTSNVDSTRRYTEITLVSTANATSSVSGQVDTTITLVSTADIRSYVLLPGLPGGLMAIWCNPITHAAASWAGTPFESVIEIDGVMFGAGVDGIYMMEDALEEDVEIDSYVMWDLLDFGDPRKHRPGDFMIDGITDAPLKVTVANEQGRWDYSTHLPKNTKTTNFRAQLGKGLNSRHLRFTVANSKSKNFWFDTAEIEVIQLARHIGGRHG